MAEGPQSYTIFWRVDKLLFPNYSGSYPIVDYYVRAGDEATREQLAKHGWLSNPAEGLRTYTECALEVHQQVQQQLTQITAAIALLQERANQLRKHPNAIHPETTTNHLTYTDEEDGNKS